MRLTLVTPPAPFITLDEARSQCRVENDQEENAVLERAIDAAISYLDGYRGILRRCIVNQQWRMDLARPCRTVRMPSPDISNVTVTYPGTIPEPVPFDLCHDGLAVNFGHAPGRAVQILFTAGFGEVSAVPAAIKVAALMLVDFFYNQRGGLSEGPGFPPEVDVMISPFKVWRV